MNSIEIRRDEKGQLDEIVVCKPTFVHLERMSDTYWWLGIDTQDGRLFHVNLTSTRNVDAWIEEQGESNRPHICVLCGDKL